MAFQKTHKKEERRKRNHWICHDDKNSQSAGLIEEDARSSRTTSTTISTVRHLGVLLLAALHGERTLNGLWLWARARQAELVGARSLHFYPKGRLPGLSSIWYVLEELEAA